MGVVRDGIALPGASGDDARLEAELEAWLRSWAMQDLAAASGWEWPRASSARLLARALAALSDDWDFRKKAAELAKTHFIERSSIPENEVLLLAEREVDPPRVIAAARALGLVDSPTELEFAPTHAVVLSGTARANVNRARFAAEVLGKAQTGPYDLIGLTAHRELGTAERASCTELGLADTDTEWTTLRDALADAFDLGAPTSVTESAPDEGDRAARFARGAVYRWVREPRSAELIVVPSPSARAENPRPANSGDQLRWWTRLPDDPTAAGSPSLTKPSSTDAVLLVTTQIYVPYQQLVAVRVLRSVAPGCRLSTIGVTAATGTVPTRNFTAQDYLQEVRSALLAAADLLDNLASGH